MALLVDFLHDFCKAFSGIRRLCRLEHRYALPVAVHVDA